jgi:two-component system nitrate/nitrite response regulator NarL
VTHSVWEYRSAIRVLVLDSSRIGSLSLAGALKREGFQVVYAGANGQEALAEITRKAVDIALLSDTLEQLEGRGYELASQVKALGPGTRVVMLVEKSDKDSVVKAFRAGARGVFGRDTHSLAALTKCVDRVHQGQVWATSEELTHILEALGTQHVHLFNATGMELLSRREQEVVHWVAEGLTNREIAERLGLSENTIKNYLFRIFDKLGVSKRIELALYATSQSAANAAGGTPFDPAATLSNDAIRFRWCAAAADRIAFLPFVLGEMLRDGHGTSPDATTALMWFVIAEQLASVLEPQARHARRVLQEQLPNAQVAAARAKAQDWLGKRSCASVTEVSGKLGKAV